MQLPFPKIRLSGLTIATILLLSAAARPLLAAAPTEAAERALHDLRQEKLDAAKHLYEETRVSYQAARPLLICSTTFDCLEGFGSGGGERQRRTARCTPIA